MIVKDWCMFCGECAGVCPRNLIEVKEFTLIFDDNECRDCSTCVNVCPVTALEKEWDYEINWLRMTYQCLLGV